MSLYMTSDYHGPEKLCSPLSIHNLRLHLVHIIAVIKQTSFNYMYCIYKAINCMKLSMDYKRYDIVYQS